jgi:hypothetical protein
VVSATVLRNQELLAALGWIGWGVLMLRLVWKAANWFVD